MGVVLSQRCRAGEVTSPDVRFPWSKRILQPATRSGRNTRQSGYLADTFPCAEELLRPLHLRLSKRRPSKSDRQCAGRSLTAKDSVPVPLSDMESEQLGQVEQRQTI